MTRDPATEPAGCNCQALRLAARRATAAYDAALASHGLRISQFALLSRLERSGPLGVQALAAALGLDRTTLGRNLHPLERDRLVLAEADPADRRARRLRISPEGAARLAAAVPAWAGAQAAFEAQFGTAAAQALRAELSRLGDAMQGQGPGSAST